MRSKGWAAATCSEQTTSTWYVTGCKTHHGGLGADVLGFGDTDTSSVLLWLGAGVGLGVGVGVVQVDATVRGGLARFINHSCDVRACDYRVHN